MTGEREPKLTLKQERFVEVMATGEPDSLADAARRAGYEDNGSSVQASVAGFRALNNPKVQQAIQSRRESYAERAGIDAVTVLKRINDRAISPETPAATAQRADEYLGDVLNLREAQQGTVDARSLTINASSEDVRELARLILGDS